MKKVLRQMLRNRRQNDINYSKRSEEKRFHSDPIFSNNKIGLYFARDKGNCVF